MKNRIYTTYDIGQSLSVDITTVMSWINQGKLAAYKTPGGHRRVLHKDLMDFLNRFHMPVPSELQISDRRVLVVDDDPNTTRLISRVIRKLNEKIIIETASDGFEAGRQMELFNPNLVILDLFLPKIDGFSVCENIRKDKKKKECKILAISGDKSKSTRERALACGADQFISKPLPLDLFGKSIAKFLSLSADPITV